MIEKYVCDEYQQTSFIIRATWITVLKNFQTPKLVFSQYCVKYTIFFIGNINYYKTMLIKLYQTDQSPFMI